MISKIKQKIKNFVDHKVNEKFEKDFDKYFQISFQQREFENASDDYLASKVEALTNVKNLAERFQKNEIEVEEQQINIPDFEKWMQEYPEVVDFYKNMGNVKIEKILEHYITYKYLNIKNSKTYIDIAASTSPFANFVSEHIGNKSFRQDLVYKKGIHGNEIGSDAGKIPVENNFADVMTLHCAYECFQGNSDVNFIIEAQRVLNKNGKLGIVPLYTDDVYFVKTGVKCDKRNVDIEKEARWIWRDDGYQEPFSRHYSPESFKSRIIDKINSLDYKIIYFTNLDELELHYKGQRIYCHFMFYAEKK